MATTAGKVLRQEFGKKKAEIGYMVSLIKEGYEIGDFLIVDDRKGTKHIGFFVNLVEDPIPVIVLASEYRNYMQEWKAPSFNVMHTVDIASIVNVKAANSKKPKEP